MSEKGKTSNVAWMAVAILGIATICGTIYMTLRQPEPARYEYHTVRRGTIEWLYRTDKVTGQVDRVDSIPGFPER